MIDVNNEDEWLGVYPSSWKRTRIKRVCTISPSYSNGKPLPTDTCSVIPMEAVSEQGALSVENQKPFEDIIAGLNLFENGDVIFAKITPCMENGKGAFVEDLPSRYAFGSTEFHVMRPLHTVDGRFLYYFTFNPTFRAWAAKNMHGAAGQQRVSSRFLKYSTLPLPNLSEQRRIAAFLDASCAAVDKAVAIKQQQLELLFSLQKSIIQKSITIGIKQGVELKDSRMSMLQRIPFNWKHSRIKSLSDIRYGLGQPPAQVDTGLPMLRATNVKRGKISKKGLIFVNPRELPAGRDPYLKSGEIIVVRSGAYTADSAMITKDWEGAIIGYDMVVTPRSIEPRFLAYALLSNYVLKDQLLLMTLRAAQPHLNAGQLGNVKIVYPPQKKEQIAICDYLDEKLNEIDSITNNIKLQVSTLHDYRKSLIHECVTGKRRITKADLARVGANV